MEDAHRNKREDTRRTTPPSRARITRARGQRLRKSQRRKLKDRFLALYGTMYTQEVCAQLGITRYTFYAWLRSDADFKARYEAKVASYELSPIADYSPSDDHIEAIFRGMSERDLMKSAMRMERARLRRGEITEAWWK